MTAPALPSAPAASPAPRANRTVLVALAGVVVGALLVGVPWLVIGLSGPGVSGMTLKAPDTIGGLSRYQDALAKRGGDKTKSLVDGENADEVKNAERLSSAYHGAGAVSQRYADAELEEIVLLQAVRADSPEPFVPYVDAARLGLAAPQQDLERVGDVVCVIYNQPTRAGEKPAEDAKGVMSCQRSGGGLTVQIVVGSSGKLRHDAGAVAALIGQAWPKLS
ncbi:hypothetical protein [Amycolatopsis sp. NPDC058986]|uniref:hypothetical protein n=1 Tax=unclassified Amycolatopsis TaxID=2618356 RepID=UPI00366AE015